MSSHRSQVLLIYSLTLCESCAFSTSAVGERDQVDQTIRMRQYELSSGLRLRSVLSDSQISEIRRIVETEALALFQTLRMDATPTAEILADLHKANWHIEARVQRFLGAEVIFEPFESMVVDFGALRASCSDIANWRTGPCSAATETPCWRQWNAAYSAGFTNSLVNLLVLSLPKGAPPFEQFLAAIQREALRGAIFAGEALEDCRH